MHTDLVCSSRSSCRRVLRLHVGFDSEARERPVDDAVLAEEPGRVQEPLHHQVTHHFSLGRVQHLSQPLDVLPGHPDACLSNIQLQQQTKIDYIGRVSSSPAVFLSI